MHRAISMNGLPLMLGGAVLASLGTALTASPAYSALLNFSFTTEEGGMGSFTLNTSVEDTRPDINVFDVYPNAISNFNFMGTQPATAEGELIVQEDQIRINSAAYGGPFRPSVGDGPESQVILGLASAIGPNFLPSDSAAYELSSASFSGVLFSPGGNPSEAIDSLTVTPASTPVSTPEPTALPSLIVLAALGVTGIKVSSSLQSCSDEE